MSFTGSDLRTRLADLVPTYDNSVTAEQDRAMRHATLVQKDIENEIRGVAEDFFLVSATFTTVADRSPNRYSLPDDFGDIRYLERVIDESTGDYDRVPPLGNIADKDFAEFDHDLRYMIDSTGTGTGKPAGYLLGSDFLQIQPISDAAYTMRIWYEKQLAAIASETNSDLPDFMFNALVLGTAVREYLYRRLSDWQDIDAKYQEALARGLAAMEQRSDDSARFVRYLEHPSEYV